MPCINHPNAPTAGTCTRCQDQLCGQCARFLDAGIFCEKCAEIEESRSFVEKQSALNQARERYRKESEVEVDEEPEQQSTANKQINTKAWGWIVGMVLAIGLYAVLYQYQNAVPDMPDLRQERLQQIAAENCRVVFTNIAQAMELGRDPNPNTTCENSNRNIIERDGSRIIVRHPNPAQFGFSEFYVTNESRQVIMRR